MSPRSSANTIASSRFPLAIVAASILGWTAVACASCPGGCATGQSWFLKGLGLYYYFGDPVAHPYPVLHTYADSAKNGADSNVTSYFTMYGAWICSPVDDAVAEAKFTKWLTYYGEVEMFRKCK